MATVTLELLKAVNGQLPCICAKCGKKASTQSELRLFYKRTRLYLLSQRKIYATKLLTLKLPFCEAHKAIWFWQRAYVIAAGFAVLLGYLVSQQIYKQSREFLGTDGSAVHTILYCGGFFVFIGLLILLRTTFIRTGIITDTHIDLKGVANEFAGACGSKRSAETSSGQR